jgi:hypothetical protein
MATFPSIRIEGGLFGPDLLDQLLAGELSGQKPRDFNMDGRRSLTDEIAGVFADARAQWEVFRHRIERVPDTDPATSITRDAWMIPFLSLLGYELRYNSRAYEVDGLSFAISHRAGENEDAPPVHIVGLRQELGRVAPTGRPRLAPHSLVQEFLNRTEQLWGIVTNGRTLRLLRDSTYIRRQAYLEFDLQQILEEQRFTDFSLLYRILHRTRLPRSAEDARDCLLEQYHQHSLEQGGRVRERLRDGVEECLRQLANGFLAHPANTELRKWVANGEWGMANGEEQAEPLTNRSPLATRHSLAPAELYRQLLRLVYRFLFLLVSEDRGLISADPVYSDHYSVGRLRRLLDRRSAYTDHDDLWCSLRVLWKVLSDERLSAFLGAAPLNGELFEPLHLDACTITNRDLLEAFWHLAYYRESPSGPPRRVNYAALDVEELGSVYESLLEFHPAIETDAAGRFEFRLIGGSERKTTGSYYTPPELVAELIRSALEPVLEERLAEAKRMAEEVKRVASGEWRVVRDRRVASGEWRVVEDAVRRVLGGSYADSVLSRLGSLAKSHGLGRTHLSADAESTEGGDLRLDKPDASVGSIGTSQYCRGLGPPGNEGISPVPQHRSGQPARAGNVSDLGATHSSGFGPGRATSARINSSFEPPTVEPPAQPQHEEVTPLAHSLAAFWSALPLATRHSLLAQAFAEEAILSMKVLDPACGSGHFLLAAARRLGKELARVRTGEDEPAPERVREAIRDVVAHCIYGVDKNPLAVELCRVALWLEAHCAGKPLTFLDHRIRCGDSLVGVFDLGVLKEGIPDKAYEPLEGDDKGVAAAVKRRNRGERAGQLTLPFDRLADTLQKHAREALDLNKIPDESVDAIEEKAHRYNAIRRSQLAIRQAADLWCAAFFQPLEPNKPVITTGAVADHLAGRPIDGRLTGLAAAIAFHQRFFHWPLEFPEVFSANGESRIVNEERKAEGPSPFPMSHSPSTGFDVVLSNPPWERIKLQEQEFFAARDRRIAEAPTKAARARLIRELPQTNPALYAEYRDALRAAEAASQFLRYGGRFPLTGRGDINTYAVFAELARSALKASGRAGIIVPTGIATDDTTKFFFQEVVQTGSLASLYDFENRKGIFPSVHKSYKFCLLTLRHSPFPIRRHSTPAEFVFFALGTEDLRRPEKRFTLTAEEIALLNPNTGNCPIFRTQADAELTKAIYRRVPVLLREASSEQRVASSGRGRDYLPDRANGQSRIANGGREAEDHLPLATHHSPGNPWRLSFKTLFHMANDSHHFRTAADLEAEGFRLAGNVFVKGDPPFATRYLPLYEAKMLHQFDHRWATYESQRGASGEWRVETRDVTDAEKADPNFVVQPRYWVREDVLEAAIPKYPEPLAEALRDGQRESVRLVLALWAAGHHLARGEERSARHMLSTIPHSPFAIRHSPFRHRPRAGAHPGARLPPRCRHPGPRRGRGAGCISQPHTARRRARRALQPEVVPRLAGHLPLDRRADAHRQRGAESRYRTHLSSGLDGKGTAPACGRATRQFEQLRR